MKRQGEAPTQPRDVAKPRPAVLGPTTLSLAASVPVPSPAGGAENQMHIDAGTMITDAVDAQARQLSHAQMMARLKQDLANGQQGGDWGLRAVDGQACHRGGEYGCPKSAKKLHSKA